MSRDWQVASSGEPFDFRHQAQDYARYRRDYSAALYQVVADTAGAGDGRLALDVGSGTGLVASALAGWGWRAVGADFSAPMLAEAPSVLPRVRARGEALPIRTGSVALVTCGTAFHWMAPRPALGEFARVLRPDGWVALFWRYARPDEPTVRAVEAALAAVGRPLPPLVRHVHGDAPFAAEPRLVPVPVHVLASTVAYGRDDFVGWASTIETFRRVAGDAHERFLDRLAAIAARELPESFVECNDEYLFLARRA